MDVDDAWTIGARLRQVRNSRRKSLRVVAGLAGMSKSRLSEIERGECALDSISEIVALANALQIVPSELMRLPVPVPANGETDSAGEAVRSAVTAASRDRPGGLVLPVTVLRDRVSATLNAHYGCHPAGKVGATLPALIRDLHASIAAGRDVAELLDLAVVLHAAGTVGWRTPAFVDRSRSSIVIDLHMTAQVSGERSRVLAQGATDPARRGHPVSRAGQWVFSPLLSGGDHPHRRRSVRGTGGRRVRSRPDWRGCACGGSARDDAPARGPTRWARQAGWAGTARVMPSDSTPIS